MKNEGRPEMKAAIEAAAEAIYESEGPESIDYDGAEALAEVAVRAAAPFLAAAALRQICLGDAEYRGEDSASRVEAALEWIARADPDPERNGDHFADLRRILSGVHCDRCNRPLPHTAVESRVCPATDEVGPWWDETPDEHGHVVREDGWCGPCEAWHHDAPMSVRRQEVPDPLADLLALPPGMFVGANRYNNDREHVLHLWTDDGRSFDVRAPKINRAASSGEAE